jgi:2-hydroxy-6-oxonona-2,4-dienedioate hydrolase
MQPTMRELARDYSVYAPDLPGVGKSEKPPQALNVTEMADALAAWLAAFELTQVVLLGNSFGCQIIVDLISRQPQWASAIVLVSPTINPQQRSFFQQFLCFLRDITHEPTTLIPIATWDYLRAGIWRSTKTLQYALKDHIEKKLPSINVPGLIVRGEFDPLVPQEWGAEAARLLPNGSLKVVKMAGHAVNYNSPVELANYVREFLDNKKS